MSGDWRPTVLEKIADGFFFQIVYLHQTKRWRWHVGSLEYPLRPRPDLKWARAAGYCVSLAKAQKTAEAAAKALVVEKAKKSNNINNLRHIT